MRRASSTSARCGASNSSSACRVASAAVTSALLAGLVAGGILGGLWFAVHATRPELLERRPGWGTDRRGATAMRLDPLTDAATLEIHGAFLNAGLNLRELIVAVTQSEIFLAPRGERPAPAP